MLARVGGTLADWQGHVIVCGLPGVGLRIVEQLALSGVPAVVVDDNPAPALARAIAAWDVPLVTGSARAAETLMSAGLPGAVAVICAQDDDLPALETALLTRRLRAEVRVVAQLTNPAVGRAVREAGVGGPRRGGAVRALGRRGVPRRGRAGDVAVRHAVPRRQDHRAGRGDAA